MPAPMIQLVQMVRLALNIGSKTNTARSLGRVTGVQQHVESMSVTWGKVFSSNVPERSWWDVTQTETNAT